MRFIAQLTVKRLSVVLARGRIYRQERPDRDNAISRCEKASAQASVDRRSAEGRRRACGPVSGRASVGDKYGERNGDGKWIGDYLHRRERDELPDVAPVAQSFRDSLMRVICRVIRRRYAAVEVMRCLSLVVLLVVLLVLLLVFLRVLMSEAVADIYAGRSDCYR